MFEIKDINKVEIYQNTIVIKLKENEESQEFEKVSIGEPIIIQKVEIEEGGITVVYGDVNCDGIVNNDDVDYLLKHLANWQGYELTEQGWVNADVNISGKIDATDVLIIQRHLANLEGYETLPYVEKATLYGDANCDGVVNNADVEYIQKYVLQVYELTEQGRLNADVNLDEKVDSIDALILLRHLENIVGYETLPYVKEATLYGDANCDGKVNNEDIECLQKYILQGYELTEQGRINADVNISGKIDATDVLIIQRHLANIEGYETLPHK